MLVQFKEVKEEYVMVVDTEFDHQVLVQFAALVFKREQGDVFRLVVSMNQFLKRNSLSSYFKNNMPITVEYLQENGLSEDEFKEMYNDTFGFLEDNNTLFVAHGAKQDKQVMRKSGLEFNYNTYCTVKRAKALLKRDNKLKLENLAAEAMYFLEGAHDAYQDAMATVVVFSYLTDLEANFSD